MTVATGPETEFSNAWSHTLDISSDSNGRGAPMNPYNWRADYGNSIWNIRHRFVASYVWEIPFFRNMLRNIFGNWQLNGITTLQSGIPMNVSIATDTANTSSSGTYRPNLVHAPSANCGDGHLSDCVLGGTSTPWPRSAYPSAHVRTVCRFFRKCRLSRSPCPR